MAPYTLTILWEKGSAEQFVDNKYSRGHTWILDGGIRLPASSSPHVVPLPFSIEAAIDPEEAFVASIASCHMLWFLSIAAAKNHVVERYEDAPEGILAKNGEGQLAMVAITLNPRVRFRGSCNPTDTQIDQLHALAHEKCFLANSVKTKIHIVPDKRGREIPG